MSATAPRRNPRRVRRVRIARWGNSLGLRIPSELAARYAISDGTVVELDDVSGGLVVRTRHKPTLNELLAGTKRRSKATTVDAGPAVGNEAV